MFVYEKLVKVLLETLGVLVSPPPNNEDFNERIAIYLLNSLACQVEGEHKRLVGNLGAIHVMQIKNQLNMYYDIQLFQFFYTCLFFLI